MLQSYIFIRYLCKYKAEIISKCQMSTGKLSCFLPRLVTKKISGSQPAGYRTEHFVEEVNLFLAFWIMG